MTPSASFQPVRSAADEHPDRLAFDDGKVQVTYRQLLAEIEDSPITKLAGLATGDHVAWCPQNDWDGFRTFWALQFLGCVACPVSHHYPPAERKKIVQRLHAKWLPDLVIGQSRDCEEVFGSLNQPATIVLSSGSTGIPKAVVHAMASHVANAKGAAVNMPLSPGDRWLWSLPLFHVSGLSILVRCAVAGATVVCLPSGDRLNNASLQRTKATHLSAVVTQLRRLRAENEFPSRHLEAILLGGSGFDESVVADARKRGVSVHTTYGLTEMASQVTTSSPEDPPGVSGRVLTGRELKIDSSGEILVRGETLCAGCYRDGKICSVVDDQGWFHTRDLGELNVDQQLIVRGRIDNMFISGGENIHPESIERAMARLFDVEQVVVVPSKDEAFGDRPVAFVKGRLPGNWRAALGEHLKSYEIPIDVFDWPDGVDAAIKPDRKRLQQMVNQDA